MQPLSLSLSLSQAGVTLTLLMNMLVLLLFFSLTLVFSDAEEHAVNGKWVCKINTHFIKFMHLISHEQTINTFINEMMQNFN